MHNTTGVKMICEYGKALCNVKIFVDIYVIKQIGLCL